MKAFKLFTAAALALCAIASPAKAGVCEFSYCLDDSQLEPWGTEKPEVYDVAVKVTNIMFVGQYVTGVQIPMPPAKNITDLKAWTSSTIDLQIVDNESVFIPDGATATAEMPTASDPGLDWKWVSVKFAEPMQIPAEGLYVGYTFAVNSITGDPASKQPVFIGKTTSEGLPATFMVRTSRTYRTWADRGLYLAKSLGMRIDMEGNFNPNAAAVSELGKYYGILDAPGSAQAIITNTGGVKITEVNYTSWVNDAKYEGTADLSKTPIVNMLDTQVVNFVLPEYGEEGEVTTKIEITAVNGVENLDDNRAVTGIGAVAKRWNFVHPLMEEVTGTGCGWCPRGFVALDYMHEKYGLDFTALAWHSYNSSDPMYPGTPFPNLTPGAPTMAVNRKMPFIDPYFGLGNTPLGVEDYFLGLRAELSPIEIEVSAEFNEEQTKINCTADIEFVNDLSEKNLWVDFILVGDDVHGDYSNYDTRRAWAQANNYNGQNYKGMPLVEDVFVGAGNPAYDLTFNLVGLASTPPGGKSNNNVKSAKVGDKTHMEHTFVTRDVYNYKGTPIPFNPQKLFVIAVLLEKGGNYGYGIDCRMCEVGGAAASLVEAKTQATEVVETQWFDLSGRRAAVEPQKGMWIRADRMADGSTRNLKVVL